MTHASKMMAKYAPIAGIAVSGLFLIFGLRYSMERDIEAALFHTGGTAVGIALGAAVVIPLLRKKAARQKDAGMIEVSLRAISGNHSLPSKWKSGEVRVTPESMEFHKHWWIFAVRPAKESVSIRIVGSVDDSFRLPGKWEKFNHLSGAHKVLRLSTESGIVEVGAAPKHLRTIQARLVPVAGRNDGRPELH